jgi:hypothetical protein
MGGLARNMRNVNQNLAARALDFPAGKLFVAQEVLLAMRTGKFEFAHNAPSGFLVMLLINSPLTGQR